MRRRGPAHTGPLDPLLGTVFSSQSCARSGTAVTGCPHTGMSSFLDIMVQQHAPCGPTHPPIPYARPHIPHPMHRTPQPAPRPPFPTRCLPDGVHQAVKQLQQLQHGVELLTHRLLRQQQAVQQCQPRHMAIGGRAGQPLRTFRWWVRAPFACIITAVRDAWGLGSQRRQEGKRFAT